MCARRRTATNAARRSRSSSWRWTRWREMPDAPEAAAVPAPVAATRPDQCGRASFTTRIAALFLGMAATALLSAYFAYRQPGIGPMRRPIVERSQTRGSSCAGLAPGGAPLCTLRHPPSPSSPAHRASRRASAAGAGRGAAPARRSNDPTRPDAAKAPDQRRPARDRQAKRSRQAPPSRKPEPARRVARPTRAEPVADKPGGGPTVKSRSGRCRTRTRARSHCSRLSPRRRCRPAAVGAGGSPPGATTSRERKAAGPSPGASDRPCAEGVALDPSLRRPDDAQGQLANRPKVRSRR